MNFIKLCLILFISNSLPLSALPTDKTKPIDLESDTVDINQATGISIYQGNVIIKQGSIQIKADKVVVYQYKNKNRSTKFIATGKPVRFRQTIDQASGDVTAHALKAEYEIDTANLLLIGNASINQPNKISMQSDRINYNQVKSTVKAGGMINGKRVKMSFTNPPK